MMKPPAEEIRAGLRKAEQEHDLPEGILWRIYIEEARVVHKGNRRDVFKNLRDFLSEAVKEKANED